MVSLQRPVKAGGDEARRSTCGACEISGLKPGVKTESIIAEPFLLGGLLSSDFFHRARVLCYVAEIILSSCFYGSTVLQTSAVSALNGVNDQSQGDRCVSGTHALTHPSPLLVSLLALAGARARRGARRPDDRQRAGHLWGRPSLRRCRAMAAARGDQGGHGRPLVKLPE